MALVVMEEKARRSSRKPWMLKDYLGDDLSSCSSNGFRSFPRRQCCAAAVRNIIDKDVIRNGRNCNKPPKRFLTETRSFSSALQRASMAVINAVKFLPFISPMKNSGGFEGNKGLLLRSFSKQVFRRSFFWKNKEKRKSSENKKKSGDGDDHEVDEIERWISSGVVGTDKYEPLDLSNDTTVTTISTTSISNSDGKSDDSSCWFDDITFTSDCSTENDVVERTEKVEQDDDVAVSKRVAEDSVKPAVSEGSMWYKEEIEKDQSSPISVLDFPYNEGNSSPFTLRVSRLKGTQERLMKKLGRFECLAGLEPVNLETLISSSEIEDRSPKYSIQPCATPSYILSGISEEEDEEEESPENEVEKQAQHLLNITKTKIPSKIKFELENVLLDFFRENVTHKANDTLLKVAENWLNGEYDTLILGWEVKDKRHAYIRDMEEGGWWPRDTILEREEVSSKLGDEVLVHLIEELIVIFPFLARSA